jgi:hypothetical protein
VITKPLYHNIWKKAKEYFSFMLTIGDMYEIMIMVVNLIKQILVPGKP